LTTIESNSPSSCKRGLPGFLRGVGGLWTSSQTRLICNFVRQGTYFSRRARQADGTCGSADTKGRLHLATILGQHYPQDQSRREAERFPRLPHLFRRSEKAGVSWSDHETLTRNFDLTTKL